MKRSLRIVLHCVLPPLFGGIVLTLVTFFIERRLADPGTTLLVFIIYGYLVAGVPSLVYAALMERAFARGVAPGSGRAIRRSSLLGSLAGLAVVAIVWIPSRQPLNSSLALLVLAGLAMGFAVGFAVGVVQWALERRVARRHARAP
jgi:hypothetical protein